MRDRYVADLRNNRPLRRVQHQSGLKVPNDNARLEGACSFGSAESLLQLVEHRLHLAEAWLITAHARHNDSGLEPLDRLWLPARAGQRLRRHEVAWRVIRIVGQECIKLGQCSRCFARGLPIPWRCRSGQSCSSGPAARISFSPANLIHLARVWSDLVPRSSGPCGDLRFGGDCRNWNMGHCSWITSELQSAACSYCSRTE